MKNPVLEGVKEALRVAILAALGVVVTALTTNSFNWKATAIAAGVAALKGVDKWIHEEKNIKLSGLLPF